MRLLCGPLYYGHVPLGTRAPVVTRALAFDKETRMATGTIKRIARDKGFGFIRDGGGQEYFFHRSAVQGSFDDLREGQRVSFEEEQSPEGPAGEQRPA